MISTPLLWGLVLRSARGEEGARIARELHDELDSALTSLKWDLEDIGKLCSEAGNQTGSSALREKIEGMMGLIDATINTVRRISSELRPGILDDLDLVAAIEWQAQQFEARTGIICQFDSFVDTTDLSREHATAIFRIFQEALTNIRRHAQATRVNIMIEEEEGEFVLEVRDNGRGIAEDERTGSQSLALSDKTISTYRTRVLEKMGMKTKHEIDAILALAGGEALERCLDAVRHGGRCAYPNGVEPEPAKRDGLEIIPYDAVAGVREFQRFGRAVEAAKPEVPIAAAFPLAEAAKAHERLAAGHVLGKIVLRI